MKKRILVVADESDILKSFPATLTLAGHEVDLAHSGLDGIKSARAAWPDLIVVDATLPDMDGSTVIEILNRLPSTMGISTLLLKPRPHRLMPLPLQTVGIRSGLIQPLDSGELLRQVGETLDLCREPSLFDMEMSEETV